MRQTPPTYGKRDTSKLSSKLIKYNLEGSQEDHKKKSQSTFKQLLSTVFKTTAVDYDQLLTLLPEVSSSFTGKQDKTRLRKYLVLIYMATLR